jgi:hypothetical protein
MHWVYAVKNDDGDIYVGETTRLYKRFNEHQTGRGGVNTRNIKPTQLVGLYHVPNNIIFMRNYDDMLEGRLNTKSALYWNGENDNGYLDVENRIVERFMLEKGILNNDIRGGKYTTKSRCESFCNGKGITEHIKDRPLCKHGYPCEINMKKDKEKMFFTCPLSRPNHWNDFYATLDVEPVCDFWQEFEPYKKSKTSFETMRNAFWVRNIPLWERGLGCLKCKNEYIDPLWSYGVKHRVCTECFQLHYEELKREYLNVHRNVSDVFADCND